MLQERLSGHTDTIASLQRQLGTAETQVESLQARVTDLVSQLQRKSEEALEWKTRCVGGVAGTEIMQDLESQRQKDANMSKYVTVISSEDSR